MRRCPKPLVAVVEGYCIGGGHIILHMLCDLTLCSDNAVFWTDGAACEKFGRGLRLSVRGRSDGPETRPRTVVPL